MKSLSIALLLLLPYCLIAQTGTLKANVYSADKTKPYGMGAMEKRQLLSGSTLDLNKFEVFTLTLRAGQQYVSSSADKKFERLIVIKSGTVNISLSDGSKAVGPGSLALILAGDEVKFQNNSTEPVSWYVLNFQSKNEDLKRGHNAGASFVSDWNSLKVTVTPKGESRQVFDLPTTMFERFDVHATVLNGGYNSHDPHQHRAEELILMIRGNSQFQIGQYKFQAENGDAVLMTSKILHAAQNTGTEPCGYYAIQWHNLKAD